jgi:hypothetical protein
MGYLLARHNPVVVQRITFIARGIYMYIQCALSKSSTHPKLQSISIIQILKNREKAKR